MATASTTTPVKHSGSSLPGFMTDKMFAINMFLLSVWVLSIPFVHHAFTAGMGFLIDGESTHPALNLSREGHYTIAIYALAAHMVAGALMNFLVPLQVHLGLTRKSKVWHRRIGISCIIIAFTGALVGSIFFAMYPDDPGTRLMRSPGNLQAGSLFGVAMFFVTYKVVQSLIQRDFKAHIPWAVAMFAMAIGSYVSRVMDGWEFAYIIAFGASAELKRYMALATAYGFWLLPLALIFSYYKLKALGAFARMPAYMPFITSLIGIAFFAVGTGFYLGVRLFA